MAQGEEISGLSSKEAAARLRDEGFNELPSAKKRNVFAIALEVVKEPMFLILLAAGMIYLFLGSLDDALILLSFVLVVIGITFYQERKTERALEALRDMSSPRALVLRDGDQKRIAGREVVRGDIVILKEGDRVPADCVVIYCSHLTVDESLLTGESMTVRKAAGSEAKIAPPGGDDLPFVYSGTLVVQGSGMAEVKAIGMDTEIGRIGKTLRNLDPERSILQKESKRLVRDMAILALSLCMLIVLVFGIARGNWLNGVLAGLTLAMATIPEEIPVAVVLFLAIGAWRISKNKVLTRQTQAIHTLGSLTVLCVDKTGTLTKNRMKVSQIYSKGTFMDADSKLPEKYHELVEFSMLSSQSDPFDPMERALKEYGEVSLAGTKHIHTNWTLVREYPLSKNLLALSHVWSSPDGRDYVIAAKGAPEAIADLCHFSKKKMESLEEDIKIMAEKGLRVIGVAKASFKKTSLPVKQHDFIFDFIGLVGFEDPVRPGVAEAIRTCYDARIRIIMITGDYPETARNIAKQIGLKQAGDLITGDELRSMDEKTLRARIQNTNIFARVVPEQKLRIVDALKANGEIVAMTGDGVNDAPALKSANIGIAMGERGTDVARESASLVLLDDAFPSIVKAIRAGRRIFDNLKKVFAYILAVHVPIAGMVILPVLLGWPLVLLPVHIAFLELIIDPVCSIVFEAEPAEPDIMRRPSNRAKAPLFSRKTLLLSILQGIFVLALVLAIFVLARRTGQTQDQSRALAFATLVVANLALIMTNRSWDRSFVETIRVPNASLWLVLGVTVVMLSVVLYVPYVMDIFHFGVLHLFDVVMCLGVGMASILWFEIFKHFRNVRRPA